MAGPHFGGAGTATSATTPTGSSTLTIASSTISGGVYAGDILVLKIGTGDSKVTVTGVTDSAGHSWSPRVGAVQTNYGNAYLYTATSAVGSSTSFTITVSFSNSASGTGYPRALCLEDYFGAVLGSPPATDSAWKASTATDSMSTAVAESFVSWVAVDWNGVTSGTPAYASGASATGSPYRVSTGGFYFARQDAPAAGAQTYGMTSPTGMKLAYAAIEVQPPPTTSYAGALSTSSASSMSVGDPQQTAVAAFAPVSQSPVSLATPWLDEVARLSTSSPSILSTVGNLVIAQALGPEVSQSSAVFTAIRRTTGTLVTSSPSSMFIAPAVPATVTPTSSPSSVVIDGSVSRTSGLSTSSGSMMFGESSVVPAEGLTTSSSSTMTLLGMLTMPLSLETSSGSSFEAEAVRETEVPTAETTSMLSTSVATFGAKVVRPAQFVETSASLSSFDAVRSTAARIETASSSSMRSAVNGQEYLGSTDSTATFTAELTVVASLSMTSSSSLVVGAQAERVVAIALTSQASFSANLYATRTASIRWVSSSTSNFSSLPTQKLGNFQTRSSSSMELEALLQIPGNALYMGSGSVAYFSADQVTPIFVEPKGLAKPQVPVPTMRLLVAETITGRIGWELPFSSLSWNSPLNKVGAMSATLLVEEAWQSLYEQGANDPRLALRETLNGPMRFSYVLAYGNAAIWAGPMQPAVDIPGDKQAVQVGGTELESILADRVLVDTNYLLDEETYPWAHAGRDIYFDQTNPRHAIWALVRQAIRTANGYSERALPIVTGPSPSDAGDENFEYKSYDLVPVWKAMTDIMARADGPDVRLKPFLLAGEDFDYVNWDLQIGDPFLPSSAPPDEYGSRPWTFDDSTSTVTRASDGIGLTTQLWVGGNGQDREKLIAMVRSKKLTDIGFPAIERVDTGSTSETEIGKLRKNAQGQIQANDIPTETWELKVPMDGPPQLGTYDSGDLARIEVFNHALIEPGVYERRITDISGDASSMVSVTCAAEDSTMAGV